MKNTLESCTKAETLLLEIYRIRTATKQCVDPLAYAIFDYASRYFVSKVNSICDVSVDSPSTEITDKNLQQLKSDVISPFIAEQNQAVRKLPLYLHKVMILKVIRKQQVVLIAAGTGTGKTTQLPQYFAFHPISRSKPVFCTLPRKIVALNMASRLNIELGSMISESLLGYTSKTISLCESPGPRRIFYFTESAFLKLLLREIYKEVPLNQTSVLILDEAHERTIESDIILGLLKLYVLPKRRHFRLIITSASLDVVSLEKLFPNHFYLDCLSREYPVDIHYLQEYTDYLHEVAKSAARVASGLVTREMYQRSLLVFLPALEEIYSVKSALEKQLESFGDRVKVLVFHGKLPILEQKTVLSPTYSSDTEIKVILTTNIAESSLTIPNVSIVIDSCREKLPIYNAELDASEMKIKKISKSSATQRTGRAGRTGPGKCYRILTQFEYSKLKDHRKPAIDRSHLGNVILKFLRFGIELTSFPLINQPDPKKIELHYKDLYTLEAIQHKDNQFYLTELGQYMLNMEIPPHYSRAIYHASNIFGCNLDIINIVAYLRSTPYIFKRTEGYEDLKLKLTIVPNAQDLGEIWNEMLKLFSSNYLVTHAILKLGELVQVLFIYRQYSFLVCEKHFNSADTLRKKCRFCDDIQRNWVAKHSLLPLGLQSAIKLNKDLTDELSTITSYQKSQFTQSDIEVESKLAFLAGLACGDSFKPSLVRKYFKLISSASELLESNIKIYEHRYEGISWCFASGFFKNTVKARGIKKMHYGYTRIEDYEILKPHPSSLYANMFNTDPPEYVLYCECLRSSFNFMKYLTPISSEVYEKIASQSALGLVNSLEEYEEIEFPGISHFVKSPLAGDVENKLQKLENELKKSGIKGSLLYLDYN